MPWYVIVPLVWGALAALAATLLILFIVLLGIEAWLVERQRDREDKAVADLDRIWDIAWPR